MNGLSMRDIRDRQTLKRFRLWRVGMVSGILILIVFSWLNEILDLPHIFFFAPQTPINWQESVIETIFISAMGAFCWKLVSAFESTWMAVAEELQRQAKTDELTGAFNRRELLYRAEQEFERAKRYDRPFSIAILDLDHFKSVNDEYGHLTGDRVLRKLIEAISSQIRPQDFVGRIGGDEFCIGFIETNRGKAVSIAERIAKRWKQIRLADSEQEQFRITFSMGITARAKDDLSLDDCIGRADKALFKAKQNGRKKVEVG